MGIVWLRILTRISIIASLTCIAHCRMPVLISHLAHVMSRINLTTSIGDAIHVEITTFLTIHLIVIVLSGGSRGATSSRYDQLWEETPCPAAPASCIRYVHFNLFSAPIYLVSVNFNLTYKVETDPKLPDMNIIMQKISIRLCHSTRESGYT